MVFSRSVTFPPALATGATTSSARFSGPMSLPVVMAFPGSTVTPIGPVAVSPRIGTAGSMMPSWFASAGGEESVPIVSGRPAAASGGASCTSSIDPSRDAAATTPTRR